jgi:hypothetical protein
MVSNLVVIDYIFLPMHYLLVDGHSLKIDTSRMTFESIVSLFSKYAVKLKEDEMQ